MTVCLPRSKVWAWIAALLITVVAVAGLAPAERGGVLAGLKPGMPVMLTEKGGRFELGIFPGVPGPLGYEVIAVSEEYVVVKDVTGVTEMWIPIFSIACVKKMTLPR